ncbi:uncharacterized protein PV07_01821 [Cladophialophora immunda]|uniref:Uncharacterized protein n=1 Tax=Cladophialophora immunda TaxID=569365 RepID=A0A0D2CVH5_9EURO|nr:uncharacterized protein PV07_01821 [Cladophialophora immunda]KIW35103.1 hypothetical protein PV07_01821 [Cladophialophora immunda]
MHIDPVTRPSSSSSSPSPTRRISPRSTQSAGEPSSSNATTVEGDPPAFHGKAEHCSSAKCFSRSNVVDFLFDGLYNIEIYPDGPFEPVRLRDEGLRIMKTYIKLRRKDRNSLLKVDECYPEFTAYPGPSLLPIGHLLSGLVPLFFREMLGSGCVTSRNVMLDFPQVASYSGFCFLINHMRLRRGAPEIYSHAPAAFLEPVLDELRLSCNVSVSKVLARRGSDLTATVRSLHDLPHLFMEICTQREDNPPVRLDFFPHHLRPHRVVAPGFDDFLTEPPNPTLLDWGHDAEDCLTAEFMVTHSDALVRGRELVFALLESTGPDFSVSRRVLEAFVVAVLPLTEGLEPMNGDIKKILAQIRRLKDISEALALSPKWWADALTNLGLATTDDLTRYTLWIDMPSTDQ